MTDENSKISSRCFVRFSLQLFNILLVIIFATEEKEKTRVIRGNKLIEFFDASFTGNIGRRVII